MKIMEALRLKHNNIKFNLLAEAINKIRLNNKNKNITLLDLGVGRCNDINKWNKLNINTIVGLDSNQEQLNEGKKRIGIQTNINLYQIDLTSKNIIEQLNILNVYKFDIIVAFFSIHYYIQNLNKIIKTVNKSDECYFICTFLHLHTSYFAFETYYENKYIYIKHINKNIIEVQFKDTPYFKDYISNELIINENNIKYSINDLIQSFIYKNFLSYYNNITQLEDDIIIIELMHGSIFCQLK